MLAGSLEEAEPVGEVYWPAGMDMLGDCCLGYEL